MAFFDDKLVFFEVFFDKELDDYTDQYHLSPLDSRILPSLEEREKIFNQWLGADQSGKAASETHPALPEDQVRYQALSATVDPFLKTNPQNCLAMFGAFRVNTAFQTGYEVYWTSA